VLRRRRRTVGDDVRAHDPELLEASLHELVQRHSAENVEPFEDHFPDPASGLGRIGVSALAWLGDDDVHDAELLLLAGGDLHRHGRLVTVLPDRHKIVAQPSGLMTE